MALSAKLLAFSKNTGTGSQAVTGAGFTVKGVVLFTGGNTANTTFQGASPGLALGLLDGAGGYTMAEGSADAVVTSAEKHTMAAKALRLLDSAGTVTAEATWTSLDSDGFTINWATNDGTARTIYALCIGGTDITNVKAHTWVGPTTSGNFSVTGVGFAPEAVLHIYGQSLQTLPYTYTAQSRISIGAMDASGNQWASRIQATSGLSPSSSARTFITNGCVTILTGAQRLSFVSMDSDGYTMNANDGAGVSGIPVISLAVKGGTWKVGSGTKPTGAAPASQAITGVGVTPKGILVHGVQTIVTLSANDMECCVGAASGTSARGSVALVNRNAANPTVAKTYSDSAKLYTKVDNGTPTVDASADLTSFDADGLTLSWSPNDAVATQFGWVIMGDNPPAPTGGNAVFDGYYGNRPFMRGGR